jgi:Mg-chelatase subunit ChlI
MTAKQFRGGATGVKLAMSLAELKKSGYSVLTVHEEMRKNLVHCLETGERILPGIIGYDDTVIPEIENAILSGHHMVFLGERGQAKSRIIRGLGSLLDEYIPIVQGCEINGPGHTMDRSRTKVRREACYAGRFHRRPDRGN